MREDDRTGVSETRPDRQYRMPPCPIHSQFRVVGHDLGGTTHRTCPLSDFEPPSTWLKGATWEIPDKWRLRTETREVVVLQLTQRHQRSSLKARHGCI